MEQDEKKKKLSTDEMLHILKQSKPKPITLDDILNPQKTPKQEPLIIEHKHRPVVIPILDNEDENLCEKEKSPVHNMLIEAFQSEISPSPGALRPGSRKVLLEETPLKEHIIREENKKTDFIDETYSPAVNEPQVKSKPSGEIKEEPPIKSKPSGEIKEELPIKAKPFGEIKEEPLIKAKPFGEIKEEPLIKAKPFGEIKEEP
ncbi:MAG: hypothetical protein ABRQ37_26980, partial [Candidatus Eremiobacterota bacterium]